MRGSPVSKRQTARKSVKPARKRTAKETGKPARKWVRGVKTVSTFPPPGTFTRPAEEIAKTMARKDVSPKGLGSGIRMIQYFINRAGKGLPASRRRELERAKRILQQRAAAEEERERPRRSSAHK